MYLLLAGCCVYIEAIIKVLSISVCYLMLHHNIHGGIPSQLWAHWLLFGVSKHFADLHG
jgi:hypothetical protein